MIYTTTDFNEQQATAQTLLVEIGAETHKLVVVDDAEQLRFAADYNPTDMGPEVAAVLDRDFAAVKVAVAGSRYALIPAAVYDEQQHDTYLRYLPFDGVGATEVTDVTPLGVKLLYQVDRIDMGTLIARFPIAGSHLQVQGLLHAAADQGLRANEPFLAIERHAPWVTIAVFNEGKFLYCHDFESGNEDDFTYHLLSVIHRFGWGDRQLAIHLAGDISVGDPYYARAAAYGQNVALADSGAWTGIRVPDDAVPHQHRFLSLFGLHQCV